MDLTLASIAASQGRAVDAADHLDRALEVAEDMASMPTDSYRRVKQQVREAAFRKIERVLSTNSDPMLRSWLSPQAGDASVAILKGSVASK